MRIDLNPSSMPELDRSSGSGATAKSVQDAANLAAAETTDVTHLSTGSDAVGKLKSQLDSLPEVRQQRVDSLRSAIRNGSFQISPSSIAQAMLTNSVAH